MGVSKVLFAALFLSLTVSVVDAYTVVMRDGRRVEIPNEFTVTNSTLTYQMGNGIQVTMQLNTVDIGATERANREAQGAFMLRANAPKVVEPAPQTRRSGAERSITNNDLEKFRHARLESEKDREELGLPSTEERRREVTDIEDRTLEQVRSMRAEEEAYWRSRADAWRAEMSANQAQFGSPVPWSFSSFGGGFPGFFPSDNFGFGISGGPFNRFRRFSPSPFDGFLATPITPFPRFPFTGRRPVFISPGARFNPRIVHTRRGSHR